MADTARPNLQPDNDLDLTQPRTEYRMRSKRLIGAFLVAARLAAPLLAQNASVSGQVVDHQHAVIIGATVTLMNTDTQVKVQAQTNGRGDFILPPVVPGHYEATALSHGFATTVLTGVTLEIGESKFLTWELGVGDVRQTVEVSGVPP